MIIVHVHVHVKPEYVEAFKSATIENASQSILEPGIARFDVLQQAGDPCRFILVEAHRNPEAPARTGAGSLNRHSHDGGHRFRGYPQCRARLS